MKKTNLRFGQYIKAKRLEDPRELTLKDISKVLNISLTYLSEIEVGRRKPFDSKRIKIFCEYFNLDSDDKALIYDLAAKEKNIIPADIEDVFMHGEIGNYARFALRQSNEGNLTEDDWKMFIRESEEKKKRG